jgi:hypothetical protein
LLRVRTSIFILPLITALVVTSCSSTAVPTSPTTVTPPGTVPQSLVGAWRGSLSSKAVKAGSDVTVGFPLNCSQRWEITSQSGEHFEGQMTSQGSGPDTDWRCTETRPFTGDVTSDHAVTIAFVPRFTPGGCSDIVGGDRASGSIADASITVALPYRAVCQMVPGGASLDLEIASTITLTPW